MLQPLEAAMSAAYQSTFARALTDPSQAVPQDIFAIHEDGAAKRFNVYRNNVIVGLLDALAARFPVTQQVVGDDFFKSMSRVFIEKHPPDSPLMMFYGDLFPDFIAAFQHAADVTYLADIARLEAARTRAYHAEDRMPLDPAALQTIGPDDVGKLLFSLHPSAEIVTSAHPIVTILAMHEGMLPLGEIADWRGEDALIARPDLDVCVHCLPSGGAAFLGCLQTGETLAQAAEAAVASHPDFDLGLNLAGIFSAGLAVALSIASPKDISP